MATPTEQLQAMRHLGENWDGYGAAAPRGDVIDLAQGFVALIEAVLTTSTSKDLVLHVSPTRTGGVLIEWEGALMQHEVELVPDGSIGFLHLEKRTGHIESHKFSPGPLQPGLLLELRQLLAA
jgi:hypothetical protein